MIKKVAPKVIDPFLCKVRVFNEKKCSGQLERLVDSTLLNTYVKLMLPLPPQPSPNGIQP